MVRANEIDTFLKNIMSIRDLRMGGAWAGVIGSTGSHGDVIDTLKKSTIAFATEYRKLHPNKTTLMTLYNDVDSKLMTAHVVSVLSEQEFDKFQSELNLLMRHMAV